MYDIIIIGGGIAGLTAGMYAMRAGMKTLMFEKLFAGGQITTTYAIENYPGFVDPIDGPEFAMLLEKHARKFGLEILYEEVKNIEVEGEIKKVITDNKEYETRTIILAMGANPKTLGLDKEEKFRGRGVSYCATCDGTFYKDRVTAVVGGGDTALEDAFFLGQYASKVYLIHRRDEFRGSKILQDRVLGHEKVEVLWDTVVESITGEEEVEGITVRNLKEDRVYSLPLDGFFVAIGNRPNNSLVDGKLDMSPDGFILTDDTMETSVPGIFAVGDLRHKTVLQIVTAASDGAVGTLSAQRYIMENFEE
ncbi:MAG: thioredoxin-disulfide reductase [Clostridiales bacterium]|nr:thioredoxin-disulfide reductase [Clostridiales bacterium]